MIELVQSTTISVIGDGSATEFILQTDKLIVDSLVSGRPSQVIFVAVLQNNIFIGSVTAVLNSSGSELTLGFSAPPPAPNPNTGLSFQVQIVLGYSGN